MPHGPVFAFALGIVSILTPCCVHSSIPYPPALPTLIPLHPSLLLCSLRRFACLHSRLVPSSPLATHPSSFVHRYFHSFSSIHPLFSPYSYPNSHTLFVFALDVHSSPASCLFVVSPLFTRAPFSLTPTGSATATATTPFLPSNFAADISASGSASGSGASGASGSASASAGANGTSTRSTPSGAAPALLGGAVADVVTAAVVAVMGGVGHGWGVVV
ncbi:hypothetical protein B0H16DRAFT_1722855 [Mycena metata]|uniref:Uncharacterized protein n=1 Tax=Mycena metata TaxID=1033252 RepID=A0AAD7NC41_9AGAR|nr:hypothetical protein B0H16DRAFT_1722855 [Mycena metata]